MLSFEFDVELKHFENKNSMYHSY